MQLQKSSWKILFFLKYCWKILWPYGSLELQPSQAACVMSCLHGWNQAACMHTSLVMYKWKQLCVFFWKRTIVCLSKRFRAVFTKRMDLGVTLRFTKCVKKINNIHMLKIWVDCCKNCADVNMMHINRCFLVRTGIILKVIKHMKEMQNFANHQSN